MEVENYAFCKNQLVRKFNQTVKDMNNENIKREKDEIEKNEKFKFFSEQICEIMPSSDAVLQEYKESDYLKKLKNSDKITIEMKKYINNLELEELSSLVNNLNNFKFNESIQNLIISETEKNIKSFLNNFKCSKKSYALRMVGEIKNKFEFTFPTQNFDIIEFEKKADEKILGYNFIEKELKEIYDLVSLFMIEKFKELINNELSFLNNFKLI